MANHDQVISKILKPLATDINELLKNATGTPIGFSLIIYPLEPGGRIQYIGNCPRASSAEALQALLNGWAQGMPNVPAHQVQ